MADNARGEKTRRGPRPDELADEPQADSSASSGLDGPVWQDDGRADDKTRQEAYDYIVTAAGLPEQSIDLEKLDVALEVVEADIDWMTELGSTPEGLQRIYGAGGLIIAINMAKVKIAVAQDPKLGYARLLPEKVSDIEKRIDGIIPQLADIYDAEGKVADFLESGDMNEQELLNAMAVLRIMKVDSDFIDLRANVPEGIGDYVDILPEVATRLGVTPDQLDKVVYDITGGGAAKLAEAAGYGHFTGVGGPPPVPTEEETRRPASSPYIGGVPASHGRSVVSHPGQRVETVGGPRYRFGDEWDMANRSQSEIRRKQKQLERAGLLQPGSYMAGFWDKASADAMFNAMEHANVRGSDVEDVVSEMVTLRPAQQAEEFIPPPEVKPDHAAIAQRVKDTFRQRLGREPTDEEMAELGGYLRGQYSAAYDALVAEERAAFEAEPPTPESLVSHPAQEVETVGGAGGPGSFTAVNPAARFAELFDKRFGPELDFIEGQEDTREAQRRFFETSERLTALITGGR